MTHILDCMTLPTLEGKLPAAGKTLAISGVPEGMTILPAAHWAKQGLRVMLVEGNDLKAGRAADDLKQLLGDQAACLPGGEIDLTRATGSMESSWRRLETLTAVADGRVHVLCTSVEALIQRMGSPKLFAESMIRLAPGTVFPPGKLAQELAAMGYERVNLVEGKGQFALRGSILDVYSPAAVSAARVEFFDDEVDTVRVLDCISQRSAEQLESLVIPPASEVVLDRADNKKAADRVRKTLEGTGVRKDEGLLFDELPPLPDDDEDLADLFDKAVAPKVRAAAYDANVTAEAERRIGRLLDDADALEQGTPFKRSRAWLTVLSEETWTLRDWFMPDVIILRDPDKLRVRAEERLQGFATDLESAIGRSEAVQEQSDLLMDWTEALKQTEDLRRVTVCDLLLGQGGIRADDAISFTATGIPGYGGKIKDLKDDCGKWLADGYRILLLCGGEARCKRLQDGLAELGQKADYILYPETVPAKGTVTILPVTLSHGFEVPEAGLVVVSDADIWGEGYRKARAHKHAGERISTFTDLKVGDYVVHEDHGVGIYHGITRIQSEGTWRDYLLIQYHGSDKLYVPVDQLERVQRFIGNPNQAPRLNKLGGTEWERQKNKVREGLRTMAFDLKKLYAERTLKRGYAFSPISDMQKDFEDEFPYELTPDQAQSVKEIMEDMGSERNMDRLLCGDVGYGKTEVSLRAAFRALMDNKQVALLAPTTILVQQHYNTVVKRFRNVGIRVEYLSRFRTPKEQRDVLRRLAIGDVDIIIGTHRLLAKDVTFHDLGLLIVDEEQRFGVAHKEVIKNMKKQVDVLTLSATPIPRTLHMSMVGIRDMSVLETPPEERMPVQTQVIEYSDAVIRDAILREVSRGGQVYFLYNRVHSIERFFARLQALVPEARIGVAHGQMQEHALEDVMMDFYAGSYDVLLCTTIIESGLDVPSANTLIVYDADRFGLSQLYQLRGRVGRSNRQAYAYFTVREDHILTEVAEQRLAAIREFTEFGAGFRIAMRDLEIRGAGNVLGPEQHGHLATVGYDMYCRLIEETVDEVQGNMKARDLDTRVDLTVDAYLPGDYVPDEKQRMEIYKRIAAVTGDDDRADLTDELIDRFGEPPEVVRTLLDVSQLRAYANRLGVSQVKRVKDTLVMKLDEHHVPDAGLLIQAMQDTDGRLSLTASKPYALVLRYDKPNTQNDLYEGLNVTRKLVARLDQLTEMKKQAEEAAAGKENE